MQSDETTPRKHERSLQINLLAPADGRISSLKQSDDAIHRQQLVGPGFLLQVQSDTIYAPCASVVSIQYSPSFTIRLKHATGLLVVLELPSRLLDHHGKGLYWYCREGETITAGQSLLRFDPVFLNQTTPLSVLLLLAPAKAIRSESNHTTTMVTSRQPCFSFQLHGI